MYLEGPLPAETYPVMGEDGNFGTYPGMMETGYRRLPAPIFPGPGIMAQKVRRVLYSQPGEFGNQCRAYSPDCGKRLDKGTEKHVTPGA
jgi:hypothetical protein